MRVPLGAQTGYATLLGASVTCVRPLPSGWIFQIWSGPLRFEKTAIQLPSGD